MSQKDIAQAVNAFMLANAPTLAEATPMTYELLKALARQLIYKVGTTKDHATYVMWKKYGSIYAQSAISMLTHEAMVDHTAQHIVDLRVRREARKSVQIQQPMLSV